MWALGRGSQNGLGARLSAWASSLKLMFEPLMNRDERWSGTLIATSCKGGRSCAAPWSRPVGNYRQLPSGFRSGL